MLLLLRLEHKIEENESEKHDYEYDGHDTHTRDAVLMVFAEARARDLVRCLVDRHLGIVVVELVVWHTVLEK